MLDVLDVLVVLAGLLDDFFESDPVHPARQMARVSRPVTTLRLGGILRAFNSGLAFRSARLAPSGGQKPVGATPGGAAPTGPYE